MLGLFSHARERRGVRERPLLSTHHQLYKPNNTRAVHTNLIIPDLSLEFLSISNVKCDAVRCVTNGLTGFCVVSLSKLKDQTPQSSLLSDFTHWLWNLDLYFTFTSNLVCYWTLNINICQPAGSLTRTNRVFVWKCRPTFPPLLSHLDPWPLMMCIWASVAFTDSLLPVWYLRDSHSVRYNPSSLFWLNQQFPFVPGFLRD